MKINVPQLNQTYSSKRKIIRHANLLYTCNKYAHSGMLHFSEAPPWHLLLKEDCSSVSIV